MLRNYYISREWIVSHSARRIYRVGAALSLGLLVMTLAAPLLADRGLMPTTGIGVSLVRLFVLMAIVGAATTWIAMEYFLFGFDDSSALKKVFWFLLLGLPPLGPAVYCFVVYSRSKYFREPVLERAATPSF